MEDTLRDKIIFLYESEFTIKEICKVLGLRKSIVKKALKIEED